jgi:hypothetical protein
MVDLHRLGCDSQCRITHLDMETRLRRSELNSKSG